MTTEPGRERGRPPSLPTRSARRVRARARDQRGFTLIEMLVVIAILGILGMIVTVSMIGLAAQAQERANAEELMTVQSAMDFMLMQQQVQPEDACNGAAARGTNDMDQFPSRARSLHPNYLRKEYLHRAYVCTGGGTVRPASG